MNNIIILFYYQYTCIFENSSSMIAYLKIVVVKTIFKPYN